MKNANKIGLKKKLNSDNRVNLSPRRVAHSIRLAMEKSSNESVFQKKSVEDVLTEVVSPIVEVSISSDANNAPINLPFQNKYLSNRTKAVFISGKLLLLIFLFGIATFSAGLWYGGWMESLQLRSALKEIPDINRCFISALF